MNLPVAVFNLRMSPGLLALGLAFYPPQAQAEPSALDLGLEELLQVVVTSVAKKAQTLGETAAAAFVISAEDIRRSGATNIPEVLRLAPGVQVAALGNNQWAVSIRGQADRYSNKLLVLVDGRSGYSPFFSGVIWENLLVPLENIERIEVLRGPGAAIWGANAVNGVINIITHSAFATQGGLATLAAGSELRGDGLIRYGWQPDPATAAQLYFQAHDTDAAQQVSGGEANDTWQYYTSGFKLERHAGQDTFQLQGGLYASAAEDEIFLVTPPVNRLAQATQTTEGGHLLGRWEHTESPTQQHNFQVYLEQSDYEHIVLGEQRTTLDLEYQVQRSYARHSLTGGLGYRYSRDAVDNSPLVTLADQARTTSRYSAYLQDEINLLPERWRLILGARLEHNDSSGFTLQPNVRLLWTPDPQTSAWVSLARALRAPSRVEQGGIVSVPTGLASALQLNNGLAQDEQLDALDLGWRHQFNPKTSLDLAAFYYHYEHLRDARVAGIVTQPSGYTLIQSINQNANRATAYGMEASLDWRLQQDWRIQASYSWLETQVQSAPGTLASGYADTSPQHQLSLQVAQDLSPTLHWDAWLRYVTAVQVHAIPDYATLDLRLSWQPSQALELSLVGQNLLNDTHPEFGSAFILSTPRELERGVYVKLRWAFE